MELRYKKVMRRTAPRPEMQESQKARCNVEVFFEMQQKEEEQERREQRAQNR